MTKREFITALAVLETGTNETFNEHQVGVWYQMLGHHDADAFKVAIQRCLLERVYRGLPQIGEINRLASEASYGIPLDAEQAFERVREAVCKYGYPAPDAAAKYVGPEIWQTISGIGGWDRVCDSPIDQRQSLFAQFRDAWQRQQSRRQQQFLLPEGIRPQQRLGYDETAPHPTVRLLAESLNAESA